MSNNNPTKFVLKFSFNDSKFSATCEEAAFQRSLLCDKLDCETHAKTELIKQFIKSQAYNEPTTAKDIWSYDTKQNTDNIAIVHYAPCIYFKPMEGDFEIMSNALTSSKVSATFFDSQIEKHLESVGIKTTRENVQIYRESYKDQISKLLLEEILKSKSVVTVRRWFDKANGDSYASINLRGQAYQINFPTQFCYSDAENLLVQCLKLEVPRTMRPSAYLFSLGIVVFDEGYKLKRDLFKAAFHI